MICPHCGKDTDVQPGASVNVPFIFENNVACAAQPYPIITNGNGQFLWTNTVCAAAAQPNATIHYITLGGNDGEH
jgi:hypothetical protein